MNGTLGGRAGGVGGGLPWRSGGAGGAGGRGGFGGSGFLDIGLFRSMLSVWPQAGCRSQAVGIHCRTTAPDEPNTVGRPRAKHGDPDYHIHSTTVTPEAAWQSSKQVESYLLCFDCERRFHREGGDLTFRQCYRGQRRFRLQEAPWKCQGGLQRFQ